jgi:hypothetical protein
VYDQCLTVKLQHKNTRKCGATRKDNDMAIKCEQGDNNCETGKSNERKKHNQLMCEGKQPNKAINGVRVMTTRFNATAVCSVTQVTLSSENATLGPQIDRRRF